MNGLRRLDTLYNFYDLNLCLAHMYEGTDNPLYTDTRYNDNIHYNDNLPVKKPSLEVAISNKLCKNIVFNT